MNSGEHENPGLSRKERELARYRNEIIEVAAALFAENGYYQTTMQMIAERAEFSVGYLYKHFSGKEEIYTDMVRFHMERLDEIIAEVADESLTPLARLHQTHVRIAEHFNDYPDFMRIYHQEIGGEFAEALERKKQHYDDLLEVKELFKAMAERGGERPFDALADTLFRYLVDPLRI